MYSVTKSPIPEKVFSEATYSEVLWWVAEKEFPQVRWSPETLRSRSSVNRAFLAAVDLGAESLEDLFTISHISVNTGADDSVIIFYRRNEGAWCFKHMMYQSEDQHRGMHDG
jgi:hypothetical protein